MSKTEREARAILAQPDDHRGLLSMPSASTFGNAARSTRRLWSAAEILTTNA